MHFGMSLFFMDKTPEKAKKIPTPGKTEWVMNL